MKKILDIKGTAIFYRNLQSQAKVILNRGSARSSKSYSILQVLVYRFLQERKKKILILRKTLPSLRISTWLAFKEIISSLGMSNFIKEEKQFLNYYLEDNFIHFGSLDDLEKIKSSEWNYIFMEEATEFDYTDYQILKLRLSAPTKITERNQIILAFNPIDEFHWIKEKLMPIEMDLEEIHSTYKDNPFLSEDYKQSLEDLAFQDPNFYRIYALGEWGRLENLIYRNWEVCQINPSDVLDTFYGLDFGFNEPSALVKIQTSKTNNKILYITEMLYQTNLTNSELIDRMHKLIDKKHSPIFADSAEPDRIKEIKLAGFNVKLAKKIILDGIDSVKRYQLKIDKYSVNIHKELKAYSWKVDRNGTPIDTPIEFLDHSLSALRYGIHSYLLRPHGVRFRWI